MRTINVKLLNEAIKRAGGIKKFAALSKVSTSWLKQAKRGDYTSEPNALTILAVCSASKMREELLFPVISKKQRAS